MQPKRHPTEDLFLHPVFLAWSAATRRRREETDVKSAAYRAARAAKTRRESRLRHGTPSARASPRCASRFPWCNRRTAYAAFLREAVTAITLVWRRRTHRLTARSAKA